MSDASQGPGWWMASDGKWYPPETAPAASSPPPAAPYETPAYGTPGYGTPGYGTPTYGTPYGGMAPQTHSGATTSLVLGIVSIVACGLLTGIPAIITGRKARREIAESGGHQTGDGMALTGLILGIVGTVLSAIGIVFFIAVLAIGISASDDINSDPSDGFCNEDRFLQDPDC